MTQIIRLSDGAGSRWAIRRTVNGSPVDSALSSTLSDLLAMPLEEAREAIRAAENDAGSAATDAQLLPPVDNQEVWAAGVTYLRSRDGRAEESAHTSLYDAVYDAERPELFLKSTPNRVVGDHDLVGIRADSDWDVPEPEIGLVINAHGELFGFVPGNDMSSRSIEGENPLYLPQAKMYERSCALGPGIVPAWEVQQPIAVALRIRREQETVFEADTSSAEMRRDFSALIDWLHRGLDFPAGVVLLTGTGIVPSREFTLAAGDVIEVELVGIGTLTNTVTVVGRR